MKNTLSIIILLFIISCQSPIEIPADLIIHNGTILTIEDEIPITDFVAVKDGKILAIGKNSEIQNFKTDSTKIIDLAGKTMLPGFVDAHSHFSLGMKMVRQADISPPPVGNVKNIGGLVKKLKKHKEKQQLSDGDWLMGWGYDPDQLVELRHPNKLDFDSIFPNNPVFLLHVSAHMAVVNSKALEIAGIDKDTENPKSGMIVRLPNSTEPNGVLQELAMYKILPFLPNPTPEQMQFLFKETQQLYASQGITTAQDGLTDYETYQFYQSISENEKLLIDINCLAGIQYAKKFLSDTNMKFNQAKNGLNLSGFKLVGDGSPQGKTAFFRQPYLTQVAGCKDDCRGFSNVPQTQLNDYVKMCYGKNIQVFAHANGDASIEMLLKAHETATDSLNIAGNDLRTVVIHSQFAGEDQLDKYAKYGFIPSFFTNHAFFWGDVHIENLGAGRANFLSPLRSATEKDITFTNHTDYIVTPLNQLFLLWTSVSRTARSGNIIGENERISPLEGLKALTINAAYQHKMEDLKGSIKVGKFADFVVLDKNPLEVDINKIKDIKVLETWKEGELIFK